MEGSSGKDDEIPAQSLSGSGASGSRRAPLSGANAGHHPRRERRSSSVSHSQSWGSPDRGNDEDRGMHRSSRALRQLPQAAHSGMTSWGAPAAPTDDLQGDTQPFSQQSSVGNATIPFDESGDRQDGIPSSLDAASQLVRQHHLHGDDNEEEEEVEAKHHGNAPRESSIDQAAAAPPASPAGDLPFWSPGSSDSRRSAASRQRPSELEDPSDCECLVDRPEADQLPGVRGRPEPEAEPEARPGTGDRPHTDEEQDDSGGRTDSALWQQATIPPSKRSAEHRDGSWSAPGDELGWDPAESVREEDFISGSDKGASVSWRETGPAGDASQGQELPRRPPNGEANDKVEADRPATPSSSVVSISPADEIPARRRGVSAAAAAAQPPTRTPDDDDDGDDILTPPHFYDHRQEVTQARKAPSSIALSVVPDNAARETEPPVPQDREGAESTAPSGATLSRATSTAKCVHRSASASANVSSPEHRTPGPPRRAETNWERGVSFMVPEKSPVRPRHRNSRQTPLRPGGASRIVASSSSSSLMSPPSPPAEGASQERHRLRRFHDEDPPSLSLTLSAKSHSNSQTLSQPRNETEGRAGALEEEVVREVETAVSDGMDDPVPAVEREEIERKTAKHPLRSVPEGHAASSSSGPEVEPRDEASGGEGTRAAPKKATPLAQRRPSRKAAQAASRAWRPLQPKHDAAESAAESSSHGGELSHTPGGSGWQEPPQAAAAPEGGLGDAGHEAARRRPPQDVSSESPPPPKKKTIPKALKELSPYNASPPDPAAVGPRSSRRVSGRRQARASKRQRDAGSSPSNPSPSSIPAPARKRHRTAGPVTSRSPTRSVTPPPLKRPKALRELEPFLPSPPRASSVLNPDVADSLAGDEGSLPPQATESGGESEQCHIAAWEWLRSATNEHPLSNGTTPRLSRWRREHTKSWWRTPLGPEQVRRTLAGWTGVSTGFPRERALTPVQRTVRLLALQWLAGEPLALRPGTPLRPEHKRPTDVIPWSPAESLLRATGSMGLVLHCTVTKQDRTASASASSPTRRRVHLWTKSQRWRLACQEQESSTLPPRSERNRWGWGWWALRLGAFQNEVEQAWKEVGASRTDQVPFPLDRGGTEELGKRPLARTTTEESTASPARGRPQRTLSDDNGSEEEMYDSGTGDRDDDVAEQDAEDEDEDDSGGGVTSYAAESNGTAAPGHSSIRAALLPSTLDVEPLRQPKTVGRFSNRDVVVLGMTWHSRTMKVLHSLARGVPVLHPLWLVASLQLGRPVEASQFALPAGRHPAHSALTLWPRCNGKRFAAETVSLCPPTFGPSWVLRPETATTTAATRGSCSSLVREEGFAAIVRSDPWSRREALTSLAPLEKSRRPLFGFRVAVARIPSQEKATWMDVLSAAGALVVLPPKRQQSSAETPTVDLIVGKNPPPHTVTQHDRYWEKVAGHVPQVSTEWVVTSLMTGQAADPTLFSMSGKGTGRSGGGIVPVPRAVKGAADREFSVVSSSPGTAPPFPVHQLSTEALKRAIRDATGSRSSAADQGTTPSDVQACVRSLVAGSVSAAGCVLPWTLDAWAEVIRCWKGERDVFPEGAGAVPLQVPMWLRSRVRVSSVLIDRRRYEAGDILFLRAPLVWAEDALFAGEQHEQPAWDGGCWLPPVHELSSLLSRGETEEDEDEEDGEEGGCRSSHAAATVVVMARLRHVLVEEAAEEASSASAVAESAAAAPHNAHVWSVHSGVVLCWTLLRGDVDCWGTVWTEDTGRWAWCDASCARGKSFMVRQGDIPALHGKASIRARKPSESALPSRTSSQSVWLGWDTLWPDVVVDGTH